MLNQFALLAGILAHYKESKVIVITGGAGFIGSATIWHLSQLGYRHIVCVDHWDSSEKWKNIAKRDLFDAIPHTRLFDWLAGYKDKVEAIVHMGACSSTTEKDMGFLIENNLHFSQKLFSLCADQNIPLIYASSAATYGNGEEGYNDSLSQIGKLRPINPYGLSKHLFDLWVIKQKSVPSLWAGLKFFNVYGPCEYHKGAMRSLVAKALPQIQSDGQVGLFKSYRQGIDHGEQKRDFVYVKDVVKVIAHFLKASRDNPDSVKSGIYNVGTGQARSFADLVKATFLAMGLPVKINWIEMPEAMRSQYQYFTQADLTRLQTVGGYKEPFCSLEEGIKDYVVNYLLAEDQYL